MIDSLIIKYRKTGNEHVLNKVYEQIHKGGVLVNKFAHKYNLDRLDVESMINDKFLSLLDSHDKSKGKFTTVLFAAIEFGCIDLLRRKKTEEEFLDDVMIELENGDIAEIYEVTEVAPTTTEADIINDIIKSHDQRQLIEAILGKADDTTLKTVSAYLQSESYRSAAKRLGVDHKTVANRIRRLARFFDELKYGQSADYYTIATA